VLRTSEVLRWPGTGREGGARSDDAVSEGGGAGIDSGVNQNMYIYPSSSASDTGFANSASSRAVTCGDVDVGMSDRNSPVRDEGSRAIEGRCEGSFCCTALGNFERCSAGMVAVIRLEGLWLTGLGALLLSSATPMQQNSPRLLCGFGRGLGRSGR
jgi:hypothetical protein